MVDSRSIEGIEAFSKPAAHSLIVQKQNGGTMCRRL
jgi:hypothetical protein